ncbi:hypothetical protein [Siphonobacter sp.]|uniref:hypothetical protein n=1 Tax=Siphonobacter sp. TaxID=1869184 RepID=UPI003B3B6B6E
MKAVLFTTFSLLLALPCFSQAITKYVTEHTVNIEHVNTSATDYRDLEPIGKAIGDARVVMLGEQDHGDATTFLAKTRLIKYLHEQKGFNVLAFESDFYGLTKGWDEVAKSSETLIPFFRENIFPIWTRSDACQYLFENYIPHTFQTQHPLQITGFDSQLFQTYSFQHLKEDLNQHLVETHVNATFVSAAAYQTFLEAVAALLAKPRKPEVFTNEMVQVLENGL